MKNYGKPAAVLALTLLVVQFRAAPTRADLLGYWPFEDGAGSEIAVDVSGNGNDGTVIDAEFVDTGRIGGAIDFGDFNNGAWVEIASAAEGAFDSLVETQSATVVFWMNRLEAPASNQWTFDFDGGASSSDPVVGRQFSSHAPWGNGQIYLDTGGCCNPDQRINGPLPDEAIAGGPPEDPASWSHLAYVRDAELEQTRIYLNGEVLLESTEGAITSPISPIIRAGIGATGDGAASHVGLMDEFAIWDEAIDEELIIAFAEGAPILQVDGIPGDFNGDEVVDVADFAILRDNFGGKFSRDEAVTKGDFNGDLRVNLKDFSGFRNAFNSLPAGAAAVPEPSTLSLLALAGALTLAFRRPTRRVLSHN